MYYNWLELVVMTDQPMSFVDNPYVQKCCKFLKMSSKTLRKYFLRVGYLVSLKIANFLPDTFGLMLDGWSSKHSREHYVVLFVVFEKDNQVYNLVLACSTLPSIADLSAASHFTYIEDTLDFYGKDINTVEYI
jgi:hypothetical protein